MYVRPTGPVCDPPSAQEVAYRSFVLKHIIRYACNLRAAGDAAPKELDELRAEAVDALEPFVESISEDERFFLICPAVELPQEQMLAAISRIDALRMLVWAVGLRSEVPAYDTFADMSLLDISNHLISDEFLAKVRLRPAAEIERQRAAAELWHWRSRTRQLLETGDAPPIPPGMSQLGVRSYPDLIRWTVEQTLREGMIDATYDGDFAAYGRPYRDLTLSEWQRVRQTTVERHYALNWLRGYAPNNKWDKTPTDT